MCWFIVYLDCFTETIIFQQIIRDYGQRRLKEIEQHRQKLKTENVVPQRKQTWSPASPCKYLNAAPKRKHSQQSRRKTGIKVSDVHLDIQPAVNGKHAGVWGTMKSMVTKTQKPVPLLPGEDVTPDRDPNQWPVIARLSHGDVIARNGELPSSQRRLSLPTSVGSLKFPGNQLPDSNGIQLIDFHTIAKDGYHPNDSDLTIDDMTVQSSIPSAQIDVLPDEDSIERFHVTNIVPDRVNEPKHPLER